MVTQIPQQLQPDVLGNALLLLDKPQVWGLIEVWTSVNTGQGGSVLCHVHARGAWHALQSLHPVP